MCVSYQPLLSNNSDTYMNRNFLFVIPSRLYYFQGKKNVTLDMLLEDLALQSRNLFYEGGVCQHVQIYLWPRSVFQAAARYGLRAVAASCVPFMARSLPEKPHALHHARYLSPRRRRQNGVIDR